MINQLNFDVEFINGEDNSFSIEYQADKKARKYCLYLPWGIIQLTIHWSES